MTTAIELAKAFADQMTNTVPFEVLDNINTANAYESNKSICHSHDFCDANQVMLDAMASVGVEPGDDALINEAWNIAKAAEFSIALIERDERGEQSRS